MGTKASLLNLLFILVILELGSQTMFLRSVSSCHEAEREALSKFKLSFTHDPNDVLGSWTGNECCHWDGVRCNNVTGHVTGLAFDNFNSLITPKLDSSLIELRHLKHLDLSWIDFQGSQIPAFIGSFQHLRYLYLFDTNFSGMIPPQLGNLSKLQAFGISFTDLSSSGSSFQVFNKLPSLVKLSLEGCELDIRSLLSNSTWLPTIQYLVLSDNNYKGTLPNVIANMTSLRHLDLSDNNYKGTLPNVIANMTSLRHLDLSLNSFIGSIPLWLSNLTNLEYINFERNSFTNVEGGGILDMLRNFCKLKYFDLSYNSLEAELVKLQYQNFSNCNTYDLEYLFLEYNNISGQIPLSIGGLSNLRAVDLSHNSLTGSIDIIKVLGQANNLTSIDLSSNSLEGVVSDSHLANLSKLEHLYLSDNSLTLGLSSNWKPPFDQLSELGLSGCRGMNGQIPNWIASLRFLKILYLSNASIRELPEWLRNLTTLQKLDLSDNMLSGPASQGQSLCQLINLVELHLKRNQLTGTIPDCWSSKRLTVFDLSSNKLSGPLPKSIGLVPRLRHLNLNNNFLEGEIPHTFTKYSPYLTVIDLGENKLSGAVPSFIAESHPYLYVLRLRANNLVGVIPKQLCTLSFLQILDLASNNLTGYIPQCFGHFKNMKNGYKVLYDLLGDVTEVLKGEALQYTSNSFLVVNMDLSCNGLVDSIPDGITSLSMLLGLNLSHNHLTSGIPEKIGEMISLESLDLSNNALSGTIPASMSALMSLSHLNLSNNKLHGEILTGPQLQTLNDPSIYSGNPGLCGDPLPNKCETEHGQHQHQQQEQDKEDSSREKIILWGIIMVGLATGFWGVVGSLWLNRWCRITLFRVVENITDYLYVKVMVRINRLRNN